MMKYRIVVVLLVLMVTSCAIGPQPIAYGSDGCHFCSMTIVDRQHAAEIVTDKGKVFKFDSSECMIILWEATLPYLPRVLFHYQQGYWQ